MKNKEQRQKNPINRDFKFDLKVEEKKKNKHYMLNLSDSDDQSSEFSAVIDIGLKPTFMLPVKRVKPSSVVKKAELPVKNEKS